MPDLHTRMKLLQLRYLDLIARCVATQAMHLNPGGDNSIIIEHALTQNLRELTELEQKVNV